MLNENKGFKNLAMQFYMPYLYYIVIS